MNEIMLLSKARPSHVQSGEHNENINGDILEYDAMGKRKKRVLLYKDGKGQLHNILLYGMTSGISSSWSRYLISFNGFQAMTGLVILSRILSCLQETSQFQSILLTLLFSVVLSEEMSYSFLNSAIFVAGVPSVGSYILHSRFRADLLRVICTLSFSFAGVAPNDTSRSWLTLVGAFMAFIIIAANIGSRAWNMVEFRPLPAGGIFHFDVMISFLVAALFGICVPYLGFSSVEEGGTKASKFIILSSLCILVVIIVTDIDYIQEYLVRGSSNCDQSVVNMTLGVWFAISLSLSILLSGRINLKDGPPIITQEDEDGNAHVEENQLSPVGWVVTNFPNISVKPSNLHQSKLYKSSFDVAFMGILTFVVGSAGGVFVFMMGFNAELIAFFNPNSVATGASTQ